MTFFRPKTVTSAPSPPAHDHADDVGLVVDTLLPLAARDVVNVILEACG